MNMNRFLFRFAGIVILTSLALSQIFSPAWLWLTAFAGCNMILASFTGFCPAVHVMKKLGIKCDTSF
jgi:hypothetical protein